MYWQTVLRCDCVSSYHNSLCRLLNSTCRSLSGLVRLLLGLADVLSLEISQRQYSDLMKKTDCEKVGNVVEPYTTLFTAYCCNLIADETRRATNELYSVSQVCGVLR